VADHQNITLRLPRKLLKQVKRVAADRDTSVSALMAEALERFGRRGPPLWCGPRARVGRTEIPSLIGDSGTTTVVARRVAWNAEPQREFVDANVLVYAFDSRLLGSSRQRGSSSRPTG
jgi:hypothetical protein